MFSIESPRLDWKSTPRVGKRQIWAPPAETLERDDASSVMEQPVLFWRKYLLIVMVANWETAGWDETHLLVFKKPKTVRFWHSGHPVEPIKLLGRPYHAWFWPVTHEIFYRWTPSTEVIKYWPYNEALMEEIRIFVFSVPAIEHRTDIYLGGHNVLEFGPKGVEYFIFEYFLRK